MTVHDALASGLLTEALALQEAAVTSDPDNPSRTRTFIDLLAFAGRLSDATRLLDSFTHETAAADFTHQLRLLLEADHLRALDGDPGTIPAPPPAHASLRLNALHLLRNMQSEEATALIDAAETASPDLRGFVNGQEFEGLRDADDCFASVLEAFHEGKYLWFPWEAIRKVQVSTPLNLLDQLYRPATVTIRDGATFAVHLPLVYPNSYLVDDALALGLETDHVCQDGGPTRCLGAKLLLVGDEGEVPLGECRMIEVR